MGETVLETPRLRLRTWDEADVDICLEHLNSPAIMRWLGPIQTRDDVWASYERGIASQAEHGHCFWIVERKDDGELLGFCGLKRVNAAGTDLTGEFEIGWRLREDAWGQGYAREAAEAALTRAFEVHGAERVVAFTVIGNSGSWGLMERLGMTRRADLDYDDPNYSGDLNPTIVYVMGRDEWKA